MIFRGMLNDRSSYRKLLVLVGFALFFVILFTMIGGLCSFLLFGTNPFTNPAAINEINSPNVLNSLKLLQTFSSIGLFIIPVFVSAFLFEIKPFKWLRLTNRPQFHILLLVLITIIFASPVINWMMVMNQHLALPSFLKGLEDWMKQSEDHAAELTKLFTASTSFTGLTINLFIIALLPAIGEELLFRGAIQPLLTDMTKNKQIGILLSAIIFSAVHLQFYGFLPRMMLGIYLGYLVAWSGSLWYSIAVHFFNNGLAVVFIFMQNRNKLPFDPDTIGTQQGDESTLIASIVFVTILIFACHRSMSNQIAVSQVE